MIIGEHGDSEIAAFSSANVSGIPVNDFCEMRGHFNHEESEKAIAERVKNAAYEIIKRKHATYYGVAVAVRRICEVIIRDEKSILPVSSMMHGEYDIDGLVLMDWRQRFQFLLMKMKSKLYRNLLKLLKRL